MIDISDLADDVYLELRKQIKDISKFASKYPSLYRLYLRVATPARGRRLEDKTK